MQKHKKNVQKHKKKCENPFNQIEFELINHRYRLNKQPKKVTKHRVRTIFKDFDKDIMSSMKKETEINPFDEIEIFFD